ncbi:hypothetical protein ACFFYR_09775, partial [Paraburkholderia dipogonis]
MSAVQWLCAAVVLVLLGAFSVLLSVTWIESRQAHQPAKRQFQTPVTDAPTSRTVVVYFSRSGNTALAASHVARRL